MKIVIDVDIRAGDEWKNTAGYSLEILDVGLTSVWCRFENGNKDYFEFNKFIQAGYLLSTRKQPEDMSFEIKQKAND